MSSPFSGESGEVIPEYYLGDGLYVRVDSFGEIILRAPREGGDHYVVMEPEVLEAFERWLKHRREDGKL